MTNRKFQLSKDMGKNKRDFKKTVDAIGANVCDEMMVVYYNVDGVDKEAISNAIGKVLGAVGAAKSHANIFFDKGHRAFNDVKQYGQAKREFFRTLFKKINKDFADEINAALKDFNAAIPEDKKDAVKVALS